MLRRLPISRIKASTDQRLDELVDWLGGFNGFAKAEITPASVDASFRRYFRCHLDNDTYIAMDAPPPQEDCKPFVNIAGYLEAMQLSAPRIIEADLERGFLLLTDLGDTQYLDRLQADPDSSVELYDDAIAALLKLQDRGAAYQSRLPPYNAAFLATELSLFHDWLCGMHLGIRFSAAEEMAWRDTCSLLIRNALDQPQVFVHRDYHSRNLMVLNDGNPGILDFQDAMEGPLTYDLASLLKDCYIRWPADRVRSWVDQYFTGIEASYRERIDIDQFSRYFELMGVQRHLKAAGIFARLNHRDGKAAYLRDIPRTLGYIIDLEGRYDELDDLIALIRQQVLPAFGNGQ